MHQLFCSASVMLNVLKIRASDMLTICLFLCTLTPTALAKHQLITSKERVHSIRYPGHSLWSPISLIKFFLAFFRKMKIVDLWELLKKWPNFVHFWFRLSPPNDFFQPRLFRCSFRSCTLWNRSLSSKNFFSQEIGHKRSYDGRNLSQKNDVIWDKQGVWTFEDVTKTFDWRSKHNFFDKC